MCYQGCSAENRNGDCTLNSNFLCDEESEDDLIIEPDEEYISDSEIDKIHNNYEKQFDK